MRPLCKLYDQFLCQDVVFGNLLEIRELRATGITKMKSNAAKYWQQVTIYYWMFFKYKLNKRCSGTVDVGSHRVDRRKMILIQKTC